MSITCDDAWCSQTACTDWLGDTRKTKVETEVCDRLRRHGSFRAYLDSRTVEVIEGTLIITGRLPSFYRKQVLQRALKRVAGVRQIDNRVAVVNCGGLSSVTNHERQWP